MNDELLRIKKSPEKYQDKQQSKAIMLYPGIELLYSAFESDIFSTKHEISEQIILINYCKSGQIAWKMKNGNYIYLNPGDFSLHTMKSCTDSIITFPTEQYAGLTVCIDLQEITAHPPELLRDTDIFKKMLKDKFCPNDTISFIAGNEQTESIFSAFYGQPEYLRQPYQKIKILELFLYLAKLEFTPKKQITAYQSEQIEIIQKVHDRLTQQIGDRITIEELSRQYLINPTTLKTMFKAVYGTSIAAHIKEYRMEQAAKMLRESDMSISEIAKAVGYDSQSKFTVAFKTVFYVLPREYRKKHK